jgi:hypothetical protein
VEHGFWCINIALPYWTCLWGIFRWCLTLHTTIRWWAYTCENRLMHAAWFGFSHKSCFLLMANMENCTVAVKPVTFEWPQIAIGDDVPLHCLPLLNLKPCN